MSDSTSSSPPSPLPPKVEFLPNQSGNFNLREDILGERISDVTVGHVAAPIVYSVLVALGLVGNLLVIYVILSRRKMRHVWNLLLLNLAVADIAFLLLTGTFTTVHYFLQDWPFGGAFCRVVQYAMFVTCYVSVYTLVVVSVFRYYMTGTWL